jgi:hypothetical protein
VNITEWRLAEGLAKVLLVQPAPTALDLSAIVPLHEQVVRLPATPVVTSGVAIPVRLANFKQNASF